MKGIVLDTETTGLPSNHLLPLDKQPRVIEIYMQEIDFNGQSDKMIFDRLVDPGIKIEEEITKITGIRDEDIKGAVTFPLISSQVKEIIENYELIIAHNASFDKEILDMEFERIGMKMNWRRVLCTVEATIHAKGFRMNLQGLHEWLFGEKFKEAHRARTDALALTRCCHELYKRGFI